VDGLNENVLAKTFLDGVTGKVSLDDLLAFYNEANAPLTEAMLADMSIGDAQNVVSAAWRSANTSEAATAWVRDVYLDHGEHGNAVIVERDEKNYLVPFTTNDSGIVFALESEWYEVQRVWQVIPTDETEPVKAEPTIPEEVAEPTEPESEEMETTEQEEEPETEEVATMELEIVFEESAGEHEEVLHSTGTVLKESALAAWDGTGPLTIRACLIEPGPGNSKDGRYYPPDMLKTCAHVFEGGKMYATDHKPEEKSVRTEVADILKCPVGFTPTGGIIAEVGIFDQPFAQSVSNRAQLGTVEKLALSIVGKGNVRRGTIDEKEYDVVTGITAGSADFVTQAGAGGHALAESETEDTMMEQSAVKEYLDGKDGVVPVILAKLSEIEFKDEDAIDEAVKTEIAYIKEASGSGDVEDMGVSDPPKEPAKGRSIEEHDAAMDKFDAMLGIRG